MHIKSIRAGYEKAPSFANKQIFIRPAANNPLLTISTRSNSSEKLTFIEHLGYLLNLTGIKNLGQEIRQKQNQTLTEQFPESIRS